MSDQPMPMTRRDALAAIALAAAGGVGGAGIRRLLGGPASAPSTSAAGAAPASGARPAAEGLLVRASDPGNLETPREALAQAFTPNASFFVRTHDLPPI